MSNYVIYWEVREPGKLASGPAEGVKGLEMDKQDLEGTAITEWWSCVGGMKGYLFADGNEVLSLDEVIDIAKSRVA